MARNGFQVSSTAVAVLAVLLCTALNQGCYADDSLSGYEQYVEYLADYGADAVHGCTVDQAGKVQLAEAAAPDIRVEGVDQQADLLPGGIDGVYKPFTCQDNKPAFLRQNSPQGEERVLWWSGAFGDWDISRGPKANEQDILMFGGEVEQHTLPLFVENWHLGGDLTSGSDKSEADDYVPVAATISRVDDQVSKTAAVQNPVHGPTTQQQATA